MTKTITAESIAEDETALLLISLSAEFYKLKWNMGSGGGMSIQTGPYIYLTPSGVQKERLAPAQLFVFHTGDTTSSPYWAYQPAGMKPSSSNEVFLWLHQHHEAKCVIHTHSLYSNLATRQPQQTNEDTWWTIDNQEYLKGIPSYPESHCYKNTDNLHIPIIPNKPTEAELSPDLREAARKNKVPCILVKNHGAYHFGKSWEQTKMSAECLEYLFELSWEITTKS